MTLPNNTSSNFNIHESEYLSQDRKPLPLSSTPSTENIILTPRTHTPIRLNSPHINMAELAIHNNQKQQQQQQQRLKQSSPLFFSDTKVSGPGTVATMASNATPHCQHHQPQFSTFSQIPNTSSKPTSQLPPSSALSSSPLEMPITTTPSYYNPQDLNDNDNHSINNDNNLPRLVHKWSHTHSILCCLASPKNRLLFCGTQDGKILVYDMNTYTLTHIIGNENNNTNTEDHHPHHQLASILTICLNKDETKLFVAGSDSLVKIYNLQKNPNGSDDDKKYQCTHVIYSLVDIGDIFSIHWCDSTSTIYIGAQNASILWCHISFDNEDLVTNGDNKNQPSNGINHNHKHKQSSQHQNNTNHHQQTHRNINNGCNDTKNISDIERLPHFRYDKFFDSKGPGGSQNTLQTTRNLLKRRYSKTTNESKHHSSIKLIECKSDDIIRFAHNGYVYCLDVITNATISDSSESNFLISGGGDGIINIWSFNHNPTIGVKLIKVASLENDESILSMKIQDSLLYVGLSDCSINVWDLLTLQLIRSFQFGDNNFDEILSLDIYDNCIYKGSSSTGLIKLSILNHQFISDKILMSLEIEDGVINAVKIFPLDDDKIYLLSGASKSLSLWDITTSKSTTNQRHDKNLNDDEEQEQEQELLNGELHKKLSNDDMLIMLQKYVAFKTISKNPQLYLEESRHCAQFLCKLFNNFGAYQTKLLPISNGNPIVFSEFKANSTTNGTGNARRPRLLWYAHYDVVDATKNEAKDWKTDPFILTAKEGNLYARGVSDNKGPTLAAIYSVAELYHRQQLNCDVVFIIEGEEECGSIGFQKVINDNKQLISGGSGGSGGNGTTGIDWIMLSNSYWLDDLTPCLNYGLRGVINASITIKSDKPDRHSGVDGGVSREPTMDMMHLLSTLVDPITRKIQLPGFYNDILPLTSSEKKLYDTIAQYLGIKVSTLMTKWREPSLTIHKIQVSGPNNNTVIPQIVKATISMRIVPNQDLLKIKQSLIDTLNENFAKLSSSSSSSSSMDTTTNSITGNKLSVEIFHQAEPWLGDHENKVYSILFKNLKNHWNQEPLFIREGGSIPLIRFLEKCFNAPAAQIPCGQLSDNAHLKDEKLRIINLFKLRAILTDTFKELGMS